MKRQAPEASARRGADGAAVDREVNDGVGGAGAGQVGPSDSIVDDVRCRWPDER